MELERKLKTALNESRLLILGAPVLFGFQFHGVFQDLFQELQPDGKLAQCIALLLLLVAICFLIAPSLVHKITYRGESRQGALAAATCFAGISLLPLTLGLGASIFTVLQHLFGRTTGIIIGASFTAVALFLLYGLGLLLRSGSGQMPDEEGATPLSVKVEQLLTEARVIIPGGQALLGFQLIATLTKAFAELPDSAKYIHAAALCAVALAVMLLMAPAALHRIAFNGEDDETFLRIGSGLVIAATFALALGIAADIHVVFFKVSDDARIAGLTALVSLLVLLGVWFAYPLWRRSAQKPRRRSSFG